MTIRLRMLTLVWCLMSTAWAADAPTPQVTGTYSNLQQSKESGDLDGFEMLILPANASYQTEYIAVVQMSDGDAPYVGIVPLAINGNKFQFNFLPDSSRANEHVEGEFKNGYLIMTFPDGSKQKLKKGKSFWAR